MAARSRGLGSNRVLGKLKLSIEKGEYYEAHQMYRTLYFRYLNLQKYSEVINLLNEGALLFFEHNQHNSAADLSILVVEALTKANMEPTGPYLDRLAQLFARLRPDSPERLTFLSAALRWSTGHPSLHQKVALVLWKEKNYAQARYHFMHTSDGNNCATMLVEYHISQGFPNELDLFVTQAVLQYLCQSNTTCATVVFWTYIENHPEMVNKGPPFLLPLLNFLWFLLMAVDGRRCGTAFTVLCEQYEPSLARDPSYTQYLSRIGQLFFGLPPSAPKSREGGVLSNLLNSLCGGAGMEDLEEAGPSTSQHQPEELD